MKNAVGLIFRGCFILQLCHLLLVAAQGWRAGFHLTGAYFWGRAYITSILKNHTRAYFQVRSYFRGNRVLLKILLYIYCSETKSPRAILLCCQGGPIASCLPPYFILFLIWAFGSKTAFSNLFFLKNPKKQKYCSFSESGSCPRSRVGAQDVWRTPISPLKVHVLHL